MPELPEVETIRRGLVSRVKGRSISGVKWGQKSALARILKVKAALLFRDIRQFGRIFLLGKKKNTL